LDRMIGRKKPKKEINFVQGGGFETRPPRSGVSDTFRKARKLPTIAMPRAQKSES